MNPIQQAISALEESGAWAPGVGRAMDILRSLQKEVEGVLPKPSLWHDPETGHWEKLTKPDRPTYEAYYTAEQLRTAVAAALGRGAVAQEDEGRVVVTWNHDRTRILAVTRQNAEWQILKVIAEAPAQPTQAEAPSEREASDYDPLIEQSLAALIDLICPDLDSGDIVHDAQQAMRELNKRAALATQQAGQGEPVSNDFVQQVPDKCDRIVWRNQYFHLPMLLRGSATPPAPGQVERDREDAVLAYLDKLEDDAAVHIWPDDLAKCQTNECVVEVASVRMGSPDGKTLPLFSRDQVRDAIRAARSSEGGAA